MYNIMHSFRNPNIGIMVLDWRLKYPPLLMNNAGMEKMRRIEKDREEHLLLKISSSLIRFDFISQFDQGSLNTERERLLKYFCSKSGNLLLKMCKGVYEPPRLPKNLFGNWHFFYFNFMHSAPIEGNTIITYLLLRTFVDKTVF